MNRGEMVTMVQNLFGDTTEAQITVDFITSALNAGQKDVARKTRCLEKRATTTSLSDDNTYELPEDYLTIFAIKYDGNLVDHVAQQTTNRFDAQAGSSHSYDIFGRTIFFYPTPDTTDVTIEIWYSGLPTDLAEDDDVSDL